MVCSEPFDTFSACSKTPVPAVPAVPAGWPFHLFIGVTTRIARNLFPLKAFNCLQ